MKAAGVAAVLVVSVGIRSVVQSTHVTAALEQLLNFELPEFNVVSSRLSNVFIER